MLLRFSAWSYSLYLVHPMVISQATRLGLEKGKLSLGSWCGSMTLILGISYLFFRLIEAPSHALAKRITLQSRTRGAEPVSHAGDP